MSQSGSGKELDSGVILRATPISQKPYFGAAVEGVKFELRALWYYFMGLNLACL